MIAPSDCHCLGVDINLCRLPSTLFPLRLQEQTDIGIVTAIAAPAALEVKFFGDGGHAGAQLMPLR